jgi:hypothetical protein
MNDVNFDRTIEVDDSDWVNSIAYNVDELVLQVKTNKGKTYRYENVSATTFARVITAKSVGKAVNRELKQLNYTVV